MTFDDVMALLKYWRKHPPLRDLVAGFIGYKPPPDTSPDDKRRPPTIAEIKMRYPDGIMRG
jgi:hypothetical protein